MSVEEIREEPIWSYEDLALFVGAVLPCLLFAVLLLRATRAVAPALFADQTARALAFQALLYAFLMGALYLLISWRYKRPFFFSLGWKFPERYRLLSVFAGPPLAIGVASLGMILRTPTIPSQIENLITGRWSLVMVMLFGTIFGPAFEELLFRGFLFPLLARSLGPWPGIILTAIPFALLHGPEYGWIWQQVLLIGIAGAVFGVARHKTGSTAAAAIVHASYNLTFFAGFVIQRWLQS